MSIITLVVSWISIDCTRFLYTQHTTDIEINFNVIFIVAVIVPVQLMKLKIMVLFWMSLLHSIISGHIIPSTFWSVIWLWKIPRCSIDQVIWDGFLVNRLVHVRICVISSDLDFQFPRSLLCIWFSETKNFIEFPFVQLISYRQHVF